MFTFCQPKMEYWPNGQTYHNFRLTAPLYFNVVNMKRKLFLSLHNMFRKMTMRNIFTNFPSDDFTTFNH